MTARAAINQLLSTVFHQLEESNLGKEVWEKLQSQKNVESNNLQNTSIMLGQATETEIVSNKNEGLQQQDQVGSPRAVTEENATNPDLEKSNFEPNLAEKVLNATKNSGSGVLSTKEVAHSKENVDQAVDAKIEAYVSRVVRSLVDDIVLHEAKMQKLKEFIQEDPNAVDTLEEELRNIPLKSVPLRHESDDPRYRKTISVNIENESGIKSGLFGW